MTEKHYADVLFKSHYNSFSGRSLVIITNLLRVNIISKFHYHYASGVNDTVGLKIKLRGR